MAGNALYFNYRREIPQYITFVSFFLIFNSNYVLHRRNMNSFQCQTIACASLLLLFQSQKKLITGNWIVLVGLKPSQPPCLRWLRKRNYETSCSYKFMRQNCIPLVLCHKYGILLTLVLNFTANIYILGKNNVRQYTFCCSLI